MSLMQYPVDYETSSTWCHLEPHIELFIYLFEFLWSLGPSWSSVKWSWTVSNLSTNRLIHRSQIKGSQALLSSSLVLKISIHTLLPFNQDKLRVGVGGESTIILFLLLWSIGSTWPLGYFFRQVERRFHSQEPNHQSLHSILDTSPLSSSSWGSSWTGESTVIKLLEFQNLTPIWRKTKTKSEEGGPGQHIGKAANDCAELGDLGHIFNPAFEGRFSSEVIVGSQLNKWWASLLGCQVLFLMCFWRLSRDEDHDESGECGSISQGLGRWCYNKHT